MKNKQNINITVSQNIIKKLNEFENKSEVINQILKEYFDNDKNNLRKFNFKVKATTIR